MPASPSSRLVPQASFVNPSGIPICTVKFYANKKCHDGSYADTAPYQPIPLSISIQTSGSPSFEGAVNILTGGEITSTTQPTTLATLPPTSRTSTVVAAEMP